jgi:glucokinase
MTILALDFGGSHTSSAVVSGGRVLASSSIQDDAGSLQQLLPRLATRLRENCQAAGVAPAECAGLGIGYPGVVDSRSGEILSTLGGKLDDAGVDELRAWSESIFQLPVKIENDARLALLGEHSAGAARGFEDVVMVTLGTGIGVAAMLGNGLLHSRLGQAGSISGHLPVQLNGRHCACGGIGCAEAEASTSVLPAIAAEWPGYSASLLSRGLPLDFATLFRVRQAGDRVAAEILGHCIAVWSALAVALINAYGPELLLFGGGVMQGGEEILEPIRAWVAQHSWKTNRGLTQIRRVGLGGDAALIGAEVLFREQADTQLI